MIGYEAADLQEATWERRRSPSVAGSRRLSRTWPQERIKVHTRNALKCCPFPSGKQIEQKKEQKNGTHSRRLEFIRNLHPKSQSRRFGA